MGVPLRGSCDAIEEVNDSDEDQEEFDESSDEEIGIDNEENTPEGQQDELGSSTNFLFGARSWYGRAVRFNNRLII